MKELANLAKIVSRERLRRGWSQKELAAKAAVGDSTLERIEQGRGKMPTARIMQKIAIAFGYDYNADAGRFVSGNGAIPQDVYDDLSALAKVERIDVVEYLRRHIRGRRHFVKGESESASATPKRKAAIHADVQQ